MDLLANLSKWPFWIDCASVVLIAAGVAKAFDWFDGLISDESRVALWYYLADVPGDEQMDSWGAVFPRLIDRVFGRKALSWKFFLRSWLASSLAVLLVISAFIRFGYVGLGSLSVEDVSELTAWLLILVLTYGALPDHISLLLSRAIIQAIEKTTKSKSLSARTKAASLIGFLGIDTLLTTIIAFISFSFSKTFFDTLLFDAMSPARSPERGIIMTYSIYAWFGLQDGLHSLISPVDTFQSLISADGGDGRIFFLSAYFTSFWLWLYVLSIFAIKVAHKARPLWLKLLPYLDIEKKPMQAIGRIAGIISGTGYLAVLGIVWLVHRRH